MSLMVGLLQHLDDPVFRLRTGLDQGHACARQIPQGTDGGRRDNARTDEAMGQERRDPAGIRLVGLVPRASPPLLGIAHEHLHRAHQDVGDRTPVDPSALQRDDRALLLGQPRAQGEQGVVGGRQRTGSAANLGLWSV